MKKIITLLFVGIIALSTNAQVKEAGNITLGKNYLMVSKVLNETRNIQIYIPNSYKDSIKKVYPVLYVLDGQDYFNSAVSFQKMLIKRNKFPEFIVVGFQTDNRKRRALFDGNSENFINFLDSELIQFIDNNYRTRKAQERMFFGWEMAGGIGIEILAQKPNLFSGYIIASPSHLSKTRLTSLEEHVKKENNSDTPFLLMTAAPGENWLNDDQQLRSFFNKKMHSELNWRYSILNREEHHTTPFKTLNEGIIDYFRNYKPVNFRSLKEYEEFGGLAALTAFYKKRGKRFNVSTEIDRSTKMFILYYAVLENNYEKFVYFENAFEGHIESNTRASWFHRYGSFYLKNKNSKEALYVYNYGLKKLGDSKLLYSGLGDVYAAKGEKRKAKKAYEKALSIDRTYKRALDGLNKL